MFSICYALLAVYAPPTKATPPFSRIEPFAIFSRVAGKVRSCIQVKTRSRDRLQCCEHLESSKFGRVILAVICFGFDNFLPNTSRRYSPI